MAVSHVNRLKKHRNLHGHYFVLKIKAYKQDTLNVVVSVKGDTEYVYTGSIMIAFRGKRL